MRLLTTLLLLSPSALLAQTWLDQYMVGQFRHDTIFEFTYIPPDFCGGYSVHFDASPIVPFAQGMSLYLDILASASVDGVASNAGTSFPLESEITTYDIFFGGTSHLPIQVRAVGIPELGGEIVPCWIDKLHSTFECSDTLTLIAGESFAPCFVGLPNGIEQRLVPSFSATSLDGVLRLYSSVDGHLDIVDMTGRTLHTISVNLNELIVLNVPSGIIIARLTSATGTFSQKIFIH